MGALTVTASAPRAPLLTRRRLRLYEPIQRRTYWLLAVVSLCLVFALWAGLSYTGAVQNLFLPTPTQVWQAAVTESNTGILWPDIGASVLRIVLGFIISSVVAIPVGMLMGSYKVFEAVPGAADRLHAVHAGGGLHPPDAHLVRDLHHAKTRHPVYRHLLPGGAPGDGQRQKRPRPSSSTWPTPSACRRRKVVRRVIFRAALPGIVDTLRISMGWGWTYLVVVELVGANNGLGFQIQQAERYLNTPEIILGIIIIGMLGLIFDFSFKAIYARAFPYMSRRARH